MTFNAVMAIVMMAAIIFCVFKDFCNTGIIFAGVSLVCGLIMGVPIRGLNFVVWDGLEQIGGIIYLMLFAVTFFGILHDAGVFKLLVRAIVKRLGNNLVSVFLITYLLSVGTQLDGSGATTALCTIPVMKPIYDKMKIRREALMLFFTVGGGTMLILPWAPGINECIGYVTKEQGAVDKAFHYAVPIMVVMAVVSIVMIFIYAGIEKRHGAGMTKEEFDAMKAAIDEDTKVENFNKPVAIFDIIFTLVIIVLMLGGWVGSNICFGIGLFVMIMVNYKNADARYDYVARQGRTLANIALTMFGLAVFLGVTQATGCFDELILFLLGDSSPSLLIHLPLICCIFSTVLQIFVGTPSFAILIPAVCTLTAPLGVDPIKFMTAFFASQVFSINLCLFSATPFLALNLADVKVKDQIKYSLVPCCAASVVIALACAAFGLIPW